MIPQGSMLAILLGYFAFLYLIGRFTAQRADSYDFFIARRQAPWYAVAFGMIGASLSGVTFVSVPGWVGNTAFSYFQMVLGYLLGYAVIAFVLLPLYYQQNLISIYGYLQRRFGYYSYQTGAWFFLISRTIGSAFRLYLVALVLHMGIFQYWHLPFAFTTLLSLLLIWLYTAKGGMKTIVWTDTLQTLFMLLAVVSTLFFIKDALGWRWSVLWQHIWQDPRSQIFFLEDWRDAKYFWKQFMAGAFIAIVMTGLDQDMMQKNLSCRTLPDAQKNVLSLSLALLPVNMLFLTLGLLLYMYAEHLSVDLPPKADMLYPMLALDYFPAWLSVVFVLGIVAAAYSSADSALTALTTSFCIDVLGIERHEPAIRERIRKRVHILITLVMWLVIMTFHWLNEESVISTIFTAAGYTYGPLLGMFTFGLFTKQQVADRWVPWVACLSPLITFVIDYYSMFLLGGYRFGFELLLVNGLITFLALYLLSRWSAA